jgi:hypothetical protein
MNALTAIAESPAQAFKLKLVVASHGGWLMIKRVP